MIIDGKEVKLICRDAYVRITEQQSCFICSASMKPKKKMRRWVAIMEDTVITSAFVCKSCYHKLPKKGIEKSFRQTTEVEICNRAAGRG